MALGSRTGRITHGTVELRTYPGREALPSRPSVNRDRHLIATVLSPWGRPPLFEAVLHRYRVHPGRALTASADRIMARVTVCTLIATICDYVHGDNVPQEARHLRKLNDAAGIIRQRG